MEKGQKIVCIDQTNQINNFEILNIVKKGVIYTVREFSQNNGVILEEFVHGFHHDGTEAGFNEERFILLSQVGNVRF